jgi:RHS repeat-associated protein
LTNGNNTFTAVAHDNYGRSSTNAVTCYLPATVSYTYDSNGNLTSDGTRNFAYDDENQLISAWVTNVWRSDFAYDGKLRRRERFESSWNGSTWVTNSVVRYVYDGNSVIQERDSNNLPLVTYTRGKDLSGSLEGAGGIGGMLARVDHRLLTIGDPGATAFYHADGNGNITCLINSKQAIVAKYLYDPFGSTISSSGSLAAANVYRFSSKECHVNSGMYYYLYRFYDPNLQRWINRDPLDEFGWQVQFGASTDKRLLDRIQKGGLLHALEMSGEINEYSFVLNGPVNEVDEAGLVTWQQTLCGFACLAACDPCFLIRTPRGRAWCMLACATPCLEYCNGPGTTLCWNLDPTPFKHKRTIAGGKNWQ